VFQKMGGEGGGDRGWPMGLAKSGRSDFPNNFDEPKLCDGVGEGVEKDCKSRIL
jgi:hypothetical protein